MEIYLHKTDLEDMLKFANDMNVEMVHVSYDNSSGIGAIIKVTAPANMNGHDGEFTKTIADETTW